jgi:Flp pilus assembly protein TadD
VIERGLLVAAAIAAAVLAGVWAHSAHLESQAQKIAERPPQTVSAAEVDRAAQLFQDSRAHNPDSRPVEREAGLLIRTGRLRQALALLRPVVSKEPDNLTAWVLIASATRTSDPALAREAIRRARALNPLGAQAR